MNKPAILITIDTEGDNLWTKPSEITTRNAEYLPRFQELCEKHRFKPTYLCDWDMVHSPVFREFGLEVLRRGTGEIGAHLHGCNTPPVEYLTESDLTYRPYVTEYPPHLVREKVKVLTSELENAFGIKMCSHRGGRWGMDETYARIVAEHGYRVESTVTPHLSWRKHPGGPTGKGGPDYSRFPEHAYFLDLDALQRPGDSALLEIPMTIVEQRWPLPVEALRRVIGWHATGDRAMRKYFPVHHWFRPDGHNREEMLKVLKIVLAERRDYVQFMLHSSEFMPGGSPRFPTAERIEALYEDMEVVFAEASRDFEGLTLKEYHDRFSAAKIGPSG
ncbi:MAG: deacetylase [Candidatus Eisenbacteria bacterium]